MATTTTDVRGVAPLTHAAAMELQAAELAATLRLLRTLDEAAWVTPVPACPAWDVRRLYLHVLGACEGAGLREMGHQMWAAMRRQRREGGPLEANLSAVQVAEREELSPAALLARLEAEAPRVVRRRRRMPALLRKGFGMKVDGPVVERWKLGYLIDTIYLRDMWLHRIDTCEALGLEPELRAGHDGRIVADVVAEWARRHGSPSTLTLDGPAGGSFAAGDDGPALHLDAVAFCRAVGGRTVEGVDTSGLLATIVPF